MLRYDVMIARMLSGGKYFQLHYNLMGLLLYMRSVIDRNVILWCTTVDPREPHQNQDSS